MRSAPSVVATLDDGARERAGILVLHAIGGAVLAVWMQGHAASGNDATAPVVLLILVLAFGGAGLLAGRRCLPPDAGRLSWDGQAWYLLSAPRAGLCPACPPRGSRKLGAARRFPESRQPVADPIALQSVVVTLDLGPWLLLRLRSATGGTAWRVVHARSAGPAWHGLRVALRAHAGVRQETTATAP